MKMPSGFVTIIHENKTSVELEQKELITCRDCKHWDGDDGDTFCSELGIFGTDPNSFCSYAKRKEE